MYIMYMYSLLLDVFSSFSLSSPRDLLYPAHAYAVSAFSFFRGKNYNYRVVCTVLVHVHVRTVYVYQYSSYILVISVAQNLRKLCASFKS
jgi:hypothetical protein